MSLVRRMFRQDRTPDQSVHIADGWSGRLWRASSLAGTTAASLWHAMLGSLRGLPGRAAGADPALPPTARTAPDALAGNAPNDVFTPTRPRAGSRILVGRKVELARMVDAIIDDAKHVVLYSERGRGKTSLANLAIDELRRRGAVVARHSCEADSDFDSLIRGLMRDLPQSLLPADSIARYGEGCEGVLPNRALHPADVAAILDRLECSFLVCAVDEFDRATDPAVRCQVADTIKLVADRGIKLHFIIVAVAATLADILGQHPSIQRNISAIHLPLLRDEEVAAMLAKGGQQAGLVFPPQATELVVWVSRGMPYMAQLLGLRIAQATRRRGGDEVEAADLEAAVQALLAEAGPGVLAIYAALAESVLDEDMPSVLRRIATAEQDELGWMAVRLAGADVILGGCRVSDSAWSLLLASGVIGQPAGVAGRAYFQDRAIIYHVQLLAARDQLAERFAPAL